MKCIRRALLLGLMLAVGLFAARCYIFQTAPPRDCPIESLVLDASVFPPGSLADPIMSPLPDAPTESAGITIGWSRGLANHDVLRMRSAAMAAKEFQREKKWQFYPEETWEVPSSLSYHSPIADQYYVACGAPRHTYMCQMTAQYEEYYVYLVAHMDPETMGIRDLERILRAVDEKMGRCLGKG